MPSYLAWCPARGETLADARQIDNAMDAADAAQRWVAWREHRDVEYPVASGLAEIVVSVNSIGRSDSGSYRVMGVPTPTYRAIRA